MTTIAPAGVHTIALTHHRELRFDRDGAVYRVAYYVPESDHAYLRSLATRANRGDAAAIKRLRELPRKRTTAQDESLRYAVKAACEAQGEARAEQIANDACHYAELMGWTA